MTCFQRKLNPAILMFLMIACSGIGGALYGYDIGVYSGALPFIRKMLHLSTNQLGIIGGAVFGGGLIGTLVAGYLSDRFGRRTMILIASLIFILGIMLLLLSHAFLSLLFSRIIIGVGVGIIAVSVPSYLSEIAPIAIRGRSVAIFQLFVTLGILFAYTIDTVFTPSGNWRGMFAFAIIPSLFLFITMSLLPESPRWLISKGKKQQAHNILKRTRIFEEAEVEIQEISVTLNQGQSQWRNLFSSSLVFPIFLSIFIAIFNQLTAINGILQYAPIIFNDAGFSSLVLDMRCAMILGLINFIGTAIGALLVDRLGRRTLLKIGTGGIVTTYFYLAIAHGIHLPPFSALIGLIVFIFCFAIGPGVVSWVIVSELFPTHVRGKGMALVLFFTSLTGWLVATLFLQTEEKLGLTGTYYFFGFCTLVYFIVIAKFLPETKQKSLEQIQIDRVIKNHVR